MFVQFIKGNLIGKNLLSSDNWKIKRVQSYIETIEIQIFINLLQKENNKFNELFL